MYAPPTEPLMFSSFSPHAGTKWQAGGGRFPSVSPTAVAHIDGPQAPPAEPRNDDSVMEESIIAVVEDDVSWESPASPRLGVPQRSVWGLSEHYQRRLAAFTAPSFPFCCGYHPLDVELPIPRHLQCEYHEQQAEADYLSMESIAPDDETCFDITAANIDAFAASCCLLCGADSHSHLHCLFYASFSMDTAPPLLLFSEWEGRPYFLSPPPVTEGSSVMDAIDVLASIETEFKKDRSKVKIWWRGMCIYGAEEARNAEWFQPAVLLGGGSREEWEESQVGAVESYSRRLICDPNSKEDGSRGNGGPSYAFRVLSGDLLYITCPELEHPPSLRRRNACLDG